MFMKSVHNRLSLSADFYLLTSGFKNKNNRKLLLTPVSVTMQPYPNSYRLVLGKNFSAGCWIQYFYFHTCGVVEEVLRNFQILQIYSLKM